MLIRCSNVWMAFNFKGFVIIIRIDNLFER